MTRIPAQAGKRQRRREQKKVDRKTVIADVIASSSMLSQSVSQGHGDQCLVRIASGGDPQGLHLNDLDLCP